MITIISPKSSYVDKSSAVLFQWTTDKPGQTHYEIMYKLKSETSWNTFNKVASTNTQASYDFSSFNDLDEYYYRIVLYYETDEFDGVEYTEAQSLMFHPPVKGSLNIKMQNAIEKIPLFSSLTSNIKEKLAARIDENTTAFNPLVDNDSSMATDAKISIKNNYSKSLSNLNPTFGYSNIGAQGDFNQSYRYTYINSYSSKPNTYVGYPSAWNYSTKVNTYIGYPSTYVGYPSTYVGYPSTYVGYPSTYVGYPSTYNTKVNTYNTKVSAYNTKVSAYNTKVSAYNTKVNTYIGYPSGYGSGAIYKSATTPATYRYVRATDGSTEAITSDTLLYYYISSYYYYGENAYYYYYVSTYKSGARYINKYGSKVYTVYKSAAKYASAYKYIAYYYSEVATYKYYYYISSYYYYVNKYLTKPNTYIGYPSAYVGYPSAYVGYPSTYVGYPSTYVGYPSAYNTKVSAYNTKVSTYQTKVNTYASKPDAYSSKPDTYMGYPTTPSSYSTKIDTYVGYPSTYADKYNRYSYGYKNN